MMTKKIWLVAVGISVLGLFLRLYQFSNRAPFDWDQNRDYTEVAKIASGRPTLIGPVARGEGGFFLGPLYYYLLLPGYTLSNGSPLALPVTSIILDSLAIATFVILGFRRGHKWLGIMLGLIWGVAAVAIDASRISWNVSLLPLWLGLFWYYLTQPSPRARDYIILGVLGGLSWHIHAVLIPLAPLLILARARSLALFSKDIGYVIGGYMAMLAPLMLFDLRHGGLQSYLMREMITAQNSLRAPLADMLVSVLSRYGKNLQHFMGFGNDLSPTLGLLATVFVMLCARTNSPLVRLASLTTMTNLVLVVALGIVGFPEYYLQTATIGTLLCLLYLLTRLVFARYITLLAILVLFVTTYTTTPTSYALIHKHNIAKEITRGGDNANIIYDLPFGRESGISTIYTSLGGTIDTESKRIYLITEKTDQTLFISGEIAQEVGYFGAFRLAASNVQ